jgi:hypothetical protein
MGKIKIMMREKKIRMIWMMVREIKMRLSKSYRRKTLTCCQRIWMSQKLTN